MSPRISVILPAYNVEAYITQALDSLLNQPIPLHQVIVLNDGSTDGTLALLQNRYSDRAELKIVSQDNQGVGAARRHGLLLADGDFVFFCDPDDLVAPELFSEFVKSYQVNPELELFYFSKRSFIDGPDGLELQRRNTAASREGWFETGGALLEDLILSGKYNAATWQYIFRRAVCERFIVRLEGRAHEDHAFSMGIYLNGKATYASSSDLYFYRERTGSLTQSKKDVRYVMDSYAAYRNTLAELRPHIPRLNQGRKVALHFMERNINALITKCIKFDVKLPQKLTHLSWTDARDCGINIPTRWTVAFPRVVYMVRRSRFAIRSLMKGSRRVV